MRRRSFLQLLFSTPALGLIKPPPQVERRVTYSDSDANTAAALTVLADSVTATGGISYQG